MAARRPRRHETGVSNLDFTRVPVGSGGGAAAAAPAGWMHAAAARASTSRPDSPGSALDGAPPHGPRGNIHGLPHLEHQGSGILRRRPASAAAPTRCPLAAPPPPWPRRTSVRSTCACQDCGRPPTRAAPAATPGNGTAFTGARDRAWASSQPPPAGPASPRAAPLPQQLPEIRVGPFRCWGSGRWSTHGREAPGGVGLGRPRWGVAIA